MIVWGSWVVDVTARMLTIPVYAASANTTTSTIIIIIIIITITTTTINEDLNSNNYH